MEKAIQRRPDRQRACEWRTTEAGGLETRDYSYAPQGEGLPEVIDLILVRTFAPDGSLLRVKEIRHRPWKVLDESPAEREARLAAEAAASLNPGSRASARAERRRAKEAALRERLAEKARQRQTRRERLAQERGERKTVRAEELARERAERSRLRETKRASGEDSRSKRPKKKTQELKGRKE